MIDYVAAEAWLGCASTRLELERCEQASSATTGGRIAELAKATFGRQAPPPARVPDVAAVASLLSEMRRWPDARSRASRFLPAAVGEDVIRVFVVANGHPWGDAYVRGVDDVLRHPQVSDTGEPVVILNAILIASQYEGSASDQAESAYGVLLHELFHILFRRYRARESRWSRFAGSVPPVDELQLLVLDEGIAHFVDREAELVRDGVPRERAEAALEQLGHAWQRLGELHGRGVEVEEILRAANQGRYWAKFGSISGMVLAYGVFRSGGREALQDAIRCGPGRLLSLYAAAADQLADLPRLPRALAEHPWIDLCRRNDA